MRRLVVNEAWRASLTFLFADAQLNNPSGSLLSRNVTSANLGSINTTGGGGSSLRERNHATTLLIPTCASTDPIRNAAGRRPFQSSTLIPLTSNLPDNDNWTDLIDVLVPNVEDSFLSSQRRNNKSAAPNL
jgi:hypothetical protein